MVDNPLAMTINQQIIMAHYNQFWGMATDVLRFAFSEAPQDAPFVAEFAIGTAEEPLFVYATIGMSDLPMPEAIQPERIELFVYTNQPIDELRYALALLATYPFQQTLPLKPLDSIYGSRPIVTGSRLSSILLTLPLREPEEFAFIEVGDYRVHLLMLTPITENERQICVQHDPLTLLSLFIEHHVDIADFTRDSAI